MSTPVTMPATTELDETALLGEEHHYVCCDVDPAVDETTFCGAAVGENDVLTTEGGVTCVPCIEAEMDPYFCPHYGVCRWVDDD